MLREDKVEEMIVTKLKELICPAPEIIGWVVGAMRTQYKDKIEERERHISNLQAKFKRISTMDEMLYDDKLAGDITIERYEEKHSNIAKQKAEIQEELANIDETMCERLEHRQVILELSQKAAEIYPDRTPAQKRIIISKLFDNLSLEGGSLSVKHSKFAQAIAQDVQKTTKLMED